MPMHSHNIRVSDDVWHRAGTRAAAEQTNVSELVRTWLSDYADTGGVGHRQRVRLTMAERDAVREALGGLDIASIVVDAVNKER
jgi:hypothetical protein